MRSLEAGDEGAEFLIVGAPNTGPGDAEMVQELVERLTRLIELFPDTAAVEDGELVVGGVRASALAERVRHAARRRTAGRPFSRGRARIREWILTRSSSTGRRRSRTSRCSGCSPRRVSAPTSPRAVSSSSRCAQACPASGSCSTATTSPTTSSARRPRPGALVVLDALDEVARAQAAGVATVLVRVTPGHRGGDAPCDPDRPCGIEVRARRRRRGRGGRDARACGARRRRAPRAHRLAAHAKRREPARGRAAGRRRARTAARSSAGRRASSTSAAASLFATRWTRPCRGPDGVRAGAARRACAHTGPSRRVLIFEPGRSLVGPAGLTLYRIGVVKRTTGVAYAAIDGGMSDNPRPQLYGSRYEALLANRADEEPAGDVPHRRQALRVRRRPHRRASSCRSLAATTCSRFPRPGAYTLAMASNYNGVPRPAAVLVDGRRRRADPPARVARRPARVRDLARSETGPHEPRRSNEARVLHRRIPAARRAAPRRTTRAAAPRARRRRASSAVAARGRRADQRLHRLRRELLPVLGAGRRARSTRSSACRRGR